MAVALFGLASLIVIPKIVNAQQTDTITLNVSPTVIELDANPGEPQKGSFKIVNGSDIALELTTTPKNFTASDELGGVNLTEEDTSYSLAKWITVSPSNVDIPARGSQIFNYTINVPDDAEPGGHQVAAPGRLQATGPRSHQRSRSPGPGAVCGH